MVVQSPPEMWFLETCTIAGALVRQPGDDFDTPVTVKAWYSFQRKAVLHVREVLFPILIVDLNQRRTRTLDHSSHI